MGNNELGILLKILLDSDKSDIEQQIRDLSGKIKERLELKLKINADDLEIITKKANEVQKKLKTQTVVKGSQFINLDVEHQAFNDITSRIREIRKNIDEFGKVNINTNSKGQITSATLTYYNKELGQTVKETMGWAEAQKKVNNESVKIKTFGTKGFSYTDDISKANQEAQKLIENMNKVNNSLYNQKSDIARRDFNYGNLISGVDATTLNSRDFASYIKQQYGESAELIGKFNDKQLKTGEIITQANFRVKEGTDKWRMYQTTLNKTTGEMRVLDNGTKDVINRQLSLSKMVTTAASKMVLWLGVGNIIFGAIHALEQGVQTLKEIDSQMVEIAKVTNLSASAMENLKNSSFDAASAYGRTAQDFLASIAEFSRAGYESQSEGLAKVSLLAQNVGELTADQANEFLLATDAAYKYKGSQEELTRVLDGANEIDNKYATSIQKISEGVSVAGSIASNAGVGINELSAAIGVMTASTQKSGNEMGRAFRGLIMNIRSVKG